MGSLMSKKGKSPSATTNDNYRSSAAPGPSPPHDGRIRDNRPRRGRDSPGRTKTDPQALLLRRMQHDLRNDPQIFILNNVMMATQYFQNFSRWEDILF